MRLSLPQLFSNIKSFATKFEFSMGDIGHFRPVVQGGLQLLDDLIRERAVDEDQTPLLSYPKSKLGITDYEFFTGKDLNRLVDGAAKALIKRGIKPVVCMLLPLVIRTNVFKQGVETTAGIYGNSNIDYIVTIFGLGRLGYTTFILSPRLPASACVSLLRDANATILLHDPQYLSVPTKTAKELPLELFPLLARSDYDFPGDSTSPFFRSGIDQCESSRKVILMHSSGTTGIPRPILYTHKDFFDFFSITKASVDFLGFPLFHAHGFVSMVVAIYGRKTLYLFNCHVPQTNDTVTAAIKAANPEVVYTVPYVLKLLAESKEGLDVLKQCKMVSSAGSRCPDELGNLLVNEGVHFGMNFGA
jgi:acyl-CoA synthetase (AMP-forming)/AMP-acid ligase II